MDELKMSTLLTVLAVVENIGTRLDIIESKIDKLLTTTHEDRSRERLKQKEEEFEAELLMNPRLQRIRFLMETPIMNTKEYYSYYQGPKDFMYPWSEWLAPKEGDIENHNNNHNTTQQSQH